MVGAADEAQKLAVATIAELASSAAARGLQVVAGGVVTGRGRPDFTFQQALATHAAMHNAEGWLFREALIEAGQELGLSMTACPPDNLYAETADAVDLAVGAIETRTRELGAGRGAPWGKDEKLSSAVAWLALARARLR